MTTKNFDVVSHFAKTLVVLALACLMLSALNPSMVAGLLAPTCGAGQYREQGTCVTPAAVVTTEDTAAQEDAAAEGEDVVMVAGEASPIDLWNALVSHAEWYDDEGTNGNGTFYVPAGTVVPVDDGLYLATLDGWAECRAAWFDQACSATGPVYLTHTPALPADHGDACAVAAGLTLDALNRGEDIFEDLSYAGMPDVVAACNDELATAYYGQGGAFGDVDALVAFLDARSIPQAGATPFV